MSYLVIDDRDDALPLSSRLIVSRHRTHAGAEQAIREETRRAKRASRDYRLDWFRAIVQETPRGLRRVDRLDDDELARGLAAALLGAKGGAAGRGKTKRRATSFDASTAVKAGTAGGAAGTGSAKRRDPAHYREMAKRSAEARKTKG